MPGSFLIRIITGRVRFNRVPHSGISPHVGTDPVSVRISLPIRSIGRITYFVLSRQGADRHGVCPYMRAFRPNRNPLFITPLAHRRLKQNRPCFASAGWKSPQTDPVLHQRAGGRLKQTLFCVSGLEVAPNRPCFASAGWKSPQTDSVLRQRAGGRLKQTLFCISGLEVVPNRLCFVSAGQRSPQTDPVLHQRAGGRLKQTLFCISGLEVVSNRPCFASAGWKSSQTDSVLHYRVPASEN